MKPFKVFHLKLDPHDSSTDLQRKTFGEGKPSMSRAGLEHSTSSPII
jgi:hypothetical protein